jgi:hypothetical protein
MKAEFNAESKARLSELLEGWGCSFETFDKLNNGSYEQALAAVSLETLDKFYGQLFKPGQSYRQAASKCPRWPKGTPKAGSFPSDKLLGKIARRIRQESTLNGVGRMAELIERVRKRTENLPGAKQSVVLDTFVTILQEEMAEEKLDGLPMGQMLKPLDRLLAKERMDRQSNIHAEKKLQKERDQELKLAQITQAQTKLELQLSQYKDKVAETKEKLEKTLTRARANSPSKETLDRLAEELKLL